MRRMRTSRPPAATGWLAAALIGLALFASGCGRKLPPIQPGVLPPPAVADLAYEVREGEILLFWNMPAFNPEKESAAAGFRVQRSRQTAAEAECRTCPTRFQAVGDIGASGRAPGSRIRFRDAPETGFVYSYKVQAYTADGRTGEESKTLAVTY